MQDLRITLFQVSQAWENKQQNEAHFNTLISEIAPSDLILLPEMFHTGFSMNTGDLAEKMPDSRGLEWLKKWAKQNQAAFYTSLIIEEAGLFFNRGVFVLPTEEIEVYDKQKLFGLGGEAIDFTPGRNTKIVTYLGWKIKLQICYDLRFPVFARNTEDYDVLIYVANWPAQRSYAWQQLLKARAIENQCYVIACNRLGIDGNGVEHKGDSAIINYLGEEIGFSNDDKVFQFNLNKASLIQYRIDFPVLEDRDDFNLI